MKLESTFARLLRYPWKDWFSKNKVVLVQGRHFFCEPHSMAVQTRAAARRLGFRVSVLIQGNRVTIIPRKI